MPTTITLAGISLTTPGQPNPIPAPQRVARKKAYQMRTGGSGGAGMRRWRRLGSHISQGDIGPFRCGYLTPSQVAQLEAIMDADESFDYVCNGTTYTVIFQERGFVPVLPRFVGPSEFWQANVSLHILSQG